MHINKFQKELIKNNIDLCLIFSFDEVLNNSLIYYAGYRGLGVLAILKKKCFMLVPEMEYEKALETNISVYKIDKKRKIFDALVVLLKKYKIKRIGLEEDKCSVFLYKKLKRGLKGRYVDISNIIKKQRMIKGKEEIKFIERACKVTDEIYRKICGRFNFESETELKKYIGNKITEAGCELAFPPIVASAEGTAQPHYSSEKKIKNGFLMLDFGAKYKGYCSDMTRMFYVGTPDKTELEKFNLVLKTITKCEKSAEILNNYSELYDVAIKCLGTNSEFFTHALGHGLGLDIHELPSLYSEDKTRIQNNVVFTIEPGIYFPDKYGIRIEDTVVLKNGKLTILTKSKKDLVII